MSKSESGNILVLVIFLIILIAGVSLFAMEKMGVTHLLNKPSSSIVPTPTKSQPLSPNTTPAPTGYQNPFEATQSSVNPFEVYENPFNNL